MLWPTSNALAAYCLATRGKSPVTWPNVVIGMGSDSTCIVCDQQFEAGDRIVRMDVLRVVEHPGDPDTGWGSPFEGGLRPSEESANRQYAHLDHIIEEPKRTNARIIEPEEIEEDA